eukprot:2253796-Amphidinium_carterae.1
MEFILHHGVDLAEVMETEIDSAQWEKAIQLPATVVPVLRVGSELIRLPGFIPKAMAPTDLTRAERFIGLTQ